VGRSAAETVLCGRKTTGTVKEGLTRGNVVIRTTTARTVGQSSCCAWNHFLVKKKTPYESGGTERFLPRETRILAVGGFGLIPLRSSRQPLKLKTLNRETGGKGPRVRASFFGRWRTTTKDRIFEEKSQRRQPIGVAGRANTA